MSRREPLTVAERIEVVRKATPPPEGRRTRKPYISKDDLAELVGCSRSRMYAWTRKEQPGYPEPQWQERLAELSGGRFQPADFSKAGEAAAQKDRLEELEDEVARLTKGQEEAQATHDLLLARVEAVERRVGLAPPQARPAELASRRAPARRGSVAP